MPLATGTVSIAMLNAVEGVILPANVTVTPGGTGAAGAKPEGVTVR